MLFIVVLSVLPWSEVMTKGKVFISLLSGEEEDLRLLVELVVCS